MKKKVGNNKIMQVFLYAAIILNLGVAGYLLLKKRTHSKPPSPVVPLIDPLQLPPPSNQSPDNPVQPSQTSPNEWRAPFAIKNFRLDHPLRSNEFKIVKGTPRGVLGLQSESGTMLALISDIYVSKNCFKNKDCVIFPNGQLFESNSELEKLIPPARYHATNPTILKK